VVSSRSFVPSHFIDIPLSPNLPRYHLSSSFLQPNGRKYDKRKGRM
jgi:hypothetical protein